jgi:hypothetical protein
VILELFLARWVQVELAQLVQKETEHYSGEIDRKSIYDIFTTHFVTDYSEHPLGGGTDAQAIAFISLSINGRRVTGVSLDHDTVSINESHYICVKSISA